MHGLNFAPTPESNNKIKGKEWLRLMRHIRSVEWQNVLNNDNQDSDLEYSFYLPEKVKTYYSITTNKVRNLDTQVKEQYNKKNNLNMKLEIASYELNKKVRNKNIVICRSDKDGKLIILNFNDYKKKYESKT